MTKFVQSAAGTFNPSNTLIIRKLSKKIREYEEIGSTNAEMQRLLGIGDLEEGIVIRADYQSAGKGHQGSTWMSQRGKNLLFSVLLTPVSLPAEEAFHLSRIVSLSLIELLGKQRINAKIKWPNDILVGSRKICGILIENSITGGAISRAVLGIGLNVNQEQFDASIPAPTSMILEKGCHFDIQPLLTEFRRILGKWYGILLEGQGDRIMDRYRACLYRLDKPARYADHTGVFTARILDVGPEGELELILEGGEVRRYGFKEVEYLD